MEDGVWFIKPEKTASELPSMGEAAERTGTTPATDDTPPVLLSDDIMAEILVHLPGSSVIRCAAVCKAWRRVTTDPHFRERCLSPASILVYSYPLGALQVSSGEADLRHLIRYRAPLTEPTHCRLLASCEGMLLFKKEAGFYLLCNPVTRQWAELLRLPGEYWEGRDREYAFYFHRPSKGSRGGALPESSPAAVLARRRRFWLAGGEVDYMPGFYG
ncbi:hypothetical protein ACP70R_005180 [Stipagrostis hirtigluma subsp. patula]